MLRIYLGVDQNFCFSNAYFEHNLTVLMHMYPILRSYLGSEYCLSSQLLGKFIGTFGA